SIRFCPLNAVGWRFSISRLRRGARTYELSPLAGCKREHLGRECIIARYNNIPEFEANGGLDLSICAIALDVPRLCSWWAVLARFLAGIGYCHVCTAGKLSRRAATTGRESHDCANSGDSWCHVNVIANTKGE